MKKIYLSMHLAFTLPLIASQKAPFCAATSQEEKVSYIALKTNLRRFVNRNNIVDSDSEMKNYFKYIKSPFVISAAIAILQDVDDKSLSRTTQAIESAPPSERSTVSNVQLNRLKKICRLKADFKNSLPK